jgi:hypothetical protein
VDELVLGCTRRPQFEPQLNALEGSSPRMVVIRGIARWDVDVCDLAVLMLGWDLQRMPIVVSSMVWCLGGRSLLNFVVSQVHSA